MVCQMFLYMFLNLCLRLDNGTLPPKPKKGEIEQPREAFAESPQRSQVYDGNGTKKNPLHNN